MQPSHSMKVWGYIGVILPLEDLSADTVRCFTCVIYRFQPDALQLSKVTDPVAAGSL